MGVRAIEALPTGTVTFLFTDVEGSTRLWEDYPDLMRVALERHDEIIGMAVQEHNGHVFTTAGDSFAAAFQDHGDAASAATSAQEALRRERWPAETPIRVRMGVHSGNAWERGGDYFGPTLNVTARLMSAGHGGQVLVSSETSGLLVGVSTQSLGVHRLKDLSEAREIFQLDAGGRFPPLRTLDRVRHNLPVTSGLLLGRESALADVTKLAETASLVTVIGVGGMGKTRLALAAAAELADGFDDGVWFCDLAPVGGSEAVIHVVAGAVGARQRPGQSLLDSVVEFCRGRRMLVVLDNCEHVLDEVADLVEAVTTVASGVAFLATSREGLGLGNEVTYPLGSLDVGRHGPAVELFVGSASRVDPVRVWLESEEAAIERICERLDGIPLAIELAAARTRLLTPVEIEERLGDAFRTLRGGRRSIERHRTLQAAIEWSYEALGEQERLLFDRLAVFAGSWDIDAAEAVCTDDRLIEFAGVADLLDELVSKSLVATERTSSGTTRYRFLEPLRQFAEDRLGQRDQGLTTRSRHLEHYTRWAESWNADVWGAGTELLERLDAEYANLRSAVAWAIEVADTDKALRIVQAMSVAHFGWGRLEIGDWGISALSLDEADDHPVGPSVAAVVASSSWWRGNTDDYGAYIDRAEAMTTYDPTANHPTIQRAVFTSQILGDPHTAKALLDRVDPADVQERSMLAFARAQMPADIDDLEGLDDAMSRLRLDAEITGSILVGIIANGSESFVRLNRLDFDAALDNARRAVDAALAIGAQFLAHLYLFTLGLAAGATNSVVPRDLELVRDGLREQRDAGQETDQWLLLVGAVAALNDARLAARIHRGLQTSMWANSRVANILPHYFEDIAQDGSSTEEPPNLNELVDEVMAAIAHILDPT